MTGKPTYEELEQRVKELEKVDAERKQAEKELRESEKRLSMALEGANEGLWDYCPLTGETYFSPPWYTMLDYEADEFPHVVKSWIELLHPEDRPRAEKRLQDFLENHEEQYSTEFRMRTKGGDWRWILSRGKAVQWDADGNITRMVGTHIDINERKQAEDELKRYHDQLTVFKQFAEKSNQGMGWADLEGCIVYINSALSRMFGVEKPEDVYGKPVQSTFYPESIEKRLNEVIFPTVLKEGKWQGESEIRTKHGKSLPTYESLFLIKDKDGNPLYFANVLSDITERKKEEEELKKYRDQLEEMVAERTINLQKANKELEGEISERKHSEEALLESEARLKEAQEMGQIGHWEFDLESEKTTWSDQVYKLYERDPSQGPPHFTEDLEVYDPDDRDRLNEEILHAIETGESVKMDFRAKLPTGRRAYFFSTFHPTKDPEGNVTKVKGTVQDITDRKLAEEALRESEDKLRIVFENVNEEIVYLDSQGTYLDVNKKVEDIFGYKPEEIIGKTFSEIPFCKPDSLENIVELFDKAASGDFTNLIELKGIRKDGTEIDIEISTNTIEKDGEIKNIISVIRDITERKKAEEALRESEEKFHNLFDLSPLAVSVTELKTGKVIDVNNKFCELTKYAPEQLLEKTTTELGFYYKNDRNLFKKELQTSGEVHGLEMEFKLKDASIPTLMFAKVVPIAGEKLIITVFYDLTERRQAESALRQSEEKYRQLADLLPQVVFETDQQGILTFTNRHALDIFGYTDDDLKKGLNALQMLIPEDRDRAFDKLQRVMRGGKSEGTEYTALSKDGSTYPALVYSSPIIREEKTVGIRGIMADLSEVKRAHEVLRENEEKLARLKKMEALGLLAGGVAHDLNNVLSGIVSYPELILMDLPNDSKFRKPIETMQESGHRAAAIVQDLLTVARGVATPKEPLDINSLIHDYLNSPEFEKLKKFHPSVAVKTNLDPHLLTTNGSHVHIRKVIMNLVSNASEAIEGSGNVIISTMNRYVDRPIGKHNDVNIGEYAIVSVSDDGSGISSDDLERIFDPFYTKKVMGKSGTGLGLSVVWNVVQDHEGYIDVITDEKGTTFELYLPITREKVADRGSVVPINDLKGDGESILVVDDGESQREISCRILDALGYKTFAVSSGEDAIEYLKEHKADLILLDMIMDPGINGRETYEGIIKIHPKQKAVIVSGFAETNEVKKTQKLGAGQYIKKPLTLERVGLAIKEELEK